MFLVSRAHETEILAHGHFVVTLLIRMGKYEIVRKEEDKDAVNLYTRFPHVLPMRIHSRMMVMIVMLMSILPG